jgi:tRNA G18 (ribose-2'-O)-methylase SpoU
MRGYFEIGIYHGKTHHNLGTLWRSAYQLGAAGIFVIGNRFRIESSDTYKTYRHVPLRQYDTLEQFLANRPHGCQLVGVEMGGTPLSGYRHPDRAVYMLGAEDHGLSRDAVGACNQIVSLESIGPLSYNVAVAGSLVMYHRQFGQSD